MFEHMIEKVQALFNNIVSYLMTLDSQVQSVYYVARISLKSYSFYDGRLHNKMYSDLCK